MVHQGLDDLDHVVVLLGGFRNQRGDLAGACLGPVVFEEIARRLLVAVLGKVRQKSARVFEGFFLVLSQEVGNTRNGIVQVAATQILRGNLLAGRRLHNRGAGDEHVRGVLRHDDEVRQRGPVDRASRTGTEDHRNLRDHSRGLGGLAEDSTVLRKCGHAFLNARTTRVKQGDDRNAHRNCAVHQEEDLISLDLAQRATAD